MDEIKLSNMVFFGCHGVYPHEQKFGQKFHVDLELKLDLEEAAKTDDLLKTIDYTSVYALVKRIVETENYQLVEALCGRILSESLSFCGVRGAVVRIRKPAAPVPGAMDYVQVSMAREK